jgi:hypothetical protein
VDYIEYYFALVDLYLYIFETAIVGIPSPDAKIKCACH